MNPYVCVTYAHDDREKSDLFCRALSRYGFRYCCINELSAVNRRRESLEQAALLIALTSTAAVQVESVASDIRHALERGMEVICCSLEGNELDHRFCTGTEEGAALIPAPVEDTPDHHALAQFVHRLFVRRLARRRECFVESQCDGNVYGSLIRCAYHAHMGDGEACFELGRAYELGLGVPVLEKEAAIWFRRAADEDVCDALIRMGLFYLAGKGIERDPKEAFRLFTRASDMGDIRGVFRCGLCYLEGQGVVKDPVHALECLKWAADRQYAPAMYRLAILCRESTGAARDIRTAMTYLYAVCRMGGSDPGGTTAPLPITVYGRAPGKRYTCISMRQMRNTRLKHLIGDSASERGAYRRSKASADRSFGRNTISRRELPEDRWAHSPAARYAEEMAERETKKRRPHTAVYETEWSAADTAGAAYELGRLLAEGSPADGLSPSPTRALVWYRYAVRLNHAEAMYELGDAYRRGYGTPSDVARAVELYRVAADRGSERGQFAYAVCCERGIGTEVDQREAVRRYEQAADGGYAPAQNNLGGCYEYGIGVPRNMLTAVEWYAAAANAGQPDGECHLGICYELGRGVPVDAEKAIRLYDLAVEQGHPYATYRRALCYDRGMYHAAEESSEGDALVPELVAEPVCVEPTDEKNPHVEKPSFEEERLRRFSVDHTRAATLYKQAADRGVALAAYAYYLCHRLERGVSRNEREEILYLRRAADGGCLQATYELGLCYMEGCGLPKDTRAAVARFARATEMWRECTEDSRLMAYLSEPDRLPPDAMTLRQAAGGALYMLGYCALYGIGTTEDRRAPALSAAPSHECVAQATPLFREAAEIDHVASIVMLGDLYAYGLLVSDTASSEDESLRYYLEAERVDAMLAATGAYTRGIALRDRTENSVDALMSLAARSLSAAEQAVDSGSMELARVNAWRSYSDAAARGSTDALVRMAECLFRGYGTPPNLTAAVRLLRRALSMDGGRVEAALWLGDSCRSRAWGETDPAAADEIYLRGLESTCLESECGPYTMGLRRADRKQEAIRIRSELYYRIATLRAVYFSDTANRKEAFSYLAAAVLMGHAAARDDLARIFEYEINRPRNTSLKAERRKRLWFRRFGRKASVRRRMQENGGLMSRGSRALRIHQEWLSRYYTALYPEPKPFAYGLEATVIPSDIPDYVKAPVTDAMRVSALQYLGECFYEGYGLKADTAAAVSCYRRVLEYAPKGGDIPPAITEATYSLGWCRLYGVGIEANHQEAIRLLTLASKTHGGACYTLGICHEEGLGVVTADDREAVKFYRKAEKFGHPNAAAKVAELERKLRTRSA